MSTTTQEKKIILHERKNTKSNTTSLKKEKFIMKDGVYTMGQSRLIDLVLKEMYG